MTMIVALVMISLAEIRLAQEIDAGQQRGEVAGHGGALSARAHTRCRSAADELARSAQLT
jgi:hypothetical protein